MQVRLLGPIDILVQGDSRPVHGLRRKAVLAILALRCGEVVSTDHLADAIWGDDAPPTSVNAMQSHVSYLRGILGTKTAILTRPPGYMLDLPGDGTDVQQAERLLREGTQSPNPLDAVRHLQDALALWRGQPLAELVDRPWLAARAERLAMVRMQLRQALSEARLMAGDPVGAQDMLGGALPRLTSTTARGRAQRLEGAIRFAQGNAAEAARILASASQALAGDDRMARDTMLMALQAAIWGDDVQPIGKKKVNLVCIFA